MWTNEAKRAIVIETQKEPLCFYHFLNIFPKNILFFMFSKNTLFFIFSKNILFFICSQDFQKRKHCLRMSTRAAKTGWVLLGKAHTALLIVFIFTDFSIQLLSVSIDVDRMLPQIFEIKQDYRHEYRRFDFRFFYDKNWLFFDLKCVFLRFQRVWRTDIEFRVYFGHILIRFGSSMP